MPDIDSIDAQQDAQTFFAGVRDPAPADPPVYCALEYPFLNEYRQTDSLVA